MKQSARKVERVPHASRSLTPAAVRIRYPDDLRKFIPESDWPVYRAMLQRAAALGLALRNERRVHELVLYGDVAQHERHGPVGTPEDRESMIEATREAGLHDLYDEKPYDRRWIYRSTRDGIIVDIIWKLANMPRERCAWTDIIDMLYATGAGFDWNRLSAGLLTKNGCCLPCFCFFPGSRPDAHENCRSDLGPLEHCASFRRSGARRRSHCAPRQPTLVQSFIERELNRKQCKRRGMNYATARAPQHGVATGA